MTTGVTSHATNNPDPETQNSPEQDLRSQKHEAGLDEQLSARRRLQPPRCCDRVRDEHPERECPERVRKAGRSDRALLRQDVSQHGEGEQRRESTQVGDRGAPVERTATPVNTPMPRPRTSRPMTRPSKAASIWSVQPPTVGTNGTRRNTTAAISKPPTHTAHQSSEVSRGCEPRCRLRVSVACGVITRAMMGMIGRPLTPVKHGSRRLAPSSEIWTAEYLEI